MSAPVLVLYATASGNAEMLAHATTERLQSCGLATQVANVADFPAPRLAEAGVALLIASTWGEGEPPPDAVGFCAVLEEPERLRLDGLSYAVLALGSSSYRDFCGCGRRIDEQLARCGARRLLPRVECDTKFKATFQTWLDQVVDVLAPRR